MKLLNKLLPIASFGAIVSITTPVLCSCANMEDLTKYEAKLTGPESIEGDVTKAYFEASNIKEILTDDFKVFARACAEDEKEYEEEKIDYVKGYISNINVEKKTLTNADNYLVSFNIGMEYSISEETKNGTTTTTKYIHSIEANISGIPYIASYMSDQYKWSITPNTGLGFDKWTTLNQDWKVKQYKKTQAYEIIKAEDGTKLSDVSSSEVRQDKTYNKDNIPAGSEELELFVQFSTILNSNYLKQIPKPSSK